MNDRSIRNQYYQPIFDFLVAILEINESRLETIISSDDEWFNDFSFVITLPELLNLYQRGMEFEREECAKITDSLSDDICKGDEWTGLGAAEEYG